MGWMDSLTSAGTWLGNSDTTGLLELGAKAGGGYMDYKAAGDARKDKLKMFNIQNMQEQNQLAFQNAEYKKKRDAEEGAWSNFGGTDPYATNSQIV